MKKLNIYIPREVHSALKEESSRRKIRMSEVVRRKIDTYLHILAAPGHGFEKSKQPRRTELQRTNLYLSEEQLEKLNKFMDEFECTKADLIRFILSQDISTEK